ncbi:ABC transporter substrate-binding protein [Achromobacter sp. RTa]|uniref:ABC transporter substrate-binding protein n=1 Tax=Achromobacter sp. RTa TaxID=1532557 RepID=UPI00068B45EA|nr:ABC transporter substrate-binding protein [Achromobacter sp. RTa]
MKKNLIALALAAACAAGPAAASARPLTVVLNADIRSTNPGVNRDGNTDGVMLNIVEGLVGYGADGLVKPLLAERVALSDDGLTYTFTLRSGVHFHNGAPLTSAEVLWSWERYMMPATDWRCRSEFDGRNGLKVTDVSAPDPRTFVMRINKPQALFLDSLARTDCAMAGVIHPDSLNPDGSWKSPVGTGPYKLAGWTRGQQISLSRYTDYVSPPGEAPDGATGKKEALVDEVRFLVVPDASTIKAGLASGALDIAKVQNIDVPEVTKNGRLAIAEDLTGGRNAILFQTRDPLMSNPKLRQALAAAIDVAQVVALVTDGKGIPNGSTVKTGSYYYSDTQKKRAAFDPARARALLKEAGYKGERIRITTNNRENIPSLNVAIVVQQMLREVGVESDIDIVEWGTHMDRFLKGNYQVMVHSYSSRIDPALSFEHFTGPKATQPRKVWDSPKAQSLLEQAAVVSDRQERQRLFDALHLQMLDEVPLIMLFNPMEPWAVSRKIRGFQPWEGMPRLWGVSFEP